MPFIIDLLCSAPSEVCLVLHKNIGVLFPSHSSTLSFQRAQETGLSFLFFQPMFYFPVYLPLWKWKSLLWSVCFDEETIWCGRRHKDEISNHSAWTLALTLLSRYHMSREQITTFGSQLLCLWKRTTCTCIPFWLQHNWILGGIHLHTEVLVIWAVFPTFPVTLDSFLKFYH